MGGTVEHEDVDFFGTEQQRQGVNGVSNGGQWLGFLFLFLFLFLLFWGVIVTLLLLRILPHFGTLLLLPLEYGKF